MQTLTYFTETQPNTTLAVFVIFGKMRGQSLSPQAAGLSLHSSLPGGRTTYSICDLRDVLKTKKSDLDDDKKVAMLN